MRNPGPKIALAAGSLALALLGTEVALRLAGYAPLEQALASRVRLVRPSTFPGRGYELVPGASGSGWGTTVAVNTLGFRGPEPGPETPASVRIVALGDSVTFGNDLAWEDAWPSALQHRLRVPGRGIEVLNLGLGGYDTQQEVATLEDLGLALRPSVVILGYCVNDVGVVSMSMETSFVQADRENPLYASRLAQWFHAHRMERTQRRALFERNREEAYGREFVSEIDPLETPVAERVDLLREAVMRAPSADQDLSTRRIPSRWYASDARIGRLAHAFARLEALGARHDFEVIVLLIPYLEDDPLIEQGLTIVRALAEARGFLVVAPREAFRAQGLERLRIRAEDPIHPNARGHVLLAEALAETIPLVLSPRAEHERAAPEVPQ